MKIYRFATMNEANMFLEEQEEEHKRNFFAWKFSEEVLDIKISDGFYVIMKNE